MFDLVEGDIELPGWFFVPEGLEGSDRQVWLATACEEAVRVPGWDGRPVSESEARVLFEEALAERDAVDAHALFIVLPSVGGVAVSCYINVLASADMPEWIEVSDVVHTIEAAHIGPGLQCSTRRTLDIDGIHGEVAGVHYVFDNGEVTLMLSLGEAAAPLVARALPAFNLLADSIRMSKVDGTPFASVSLGGPVEDAPWSFEESM